MSAVREVKYLRELHHQNIIEVCYMIVPMQRFNPTTLAKLLDVFSSKTNLNLVLEFLDSDLEIVIKDRSLVFLPADIKSWMAMTFRGLEFCHRSFILHRVRRRRRRGEVPLFAPCSATPYTTIAGFKAQQLAHRVRRAAQTRRLWSRARLCGARVQNDEPGHHPVSALSDRPVGCSYVQDRWYRPPELLFGCRYYSSAVDTWSVGCIFAELMLRTPYLPGETDMDQLKTIFRALGTPTEEEWPVSRRTDAPAHILHTGTMQGHTKLPDYVPVGQFPKTPLRDLFTAASGDALNMLSRCLTYEPGRRISALEVSYYSRESVAHDLFIPPPGSSPSLLHQFAISHSPIQAPQTCLADIPASRGGRRKRRHGGRRSRRKSRRTQPTEAKTLVSHGRPPTTPSAARFHTAQVDRPPTATARFRYQL